MKKWLQLLGVFMLFVQQSQAQNPHFYKDGANTVNNPFPFVQASAHTQLMYTPNDFAVKPPSGNITKIHFRTYYFETVNTAIYDTLVISFKQTTDTQFANNNFYTGLTPALNNPGYTYITTANVSKDGWVEFSLSTPYTYDNTKTLIVDIRYTQSSGFLNNWSDSIVNYKTCNSTSLTATQGILSHSWNHFGMDITATSACSGPPTAGTTTWKKTGLCGGNSYLLDIAGSSGGTGLQYQWQSASGAAGPFLNTGSASASSAYTATVTANTWYRAAVICGAFTAYTTPVALTPNSYLLSGTYTINSALPSGGSNFKSFNTMVDAISCGITGSVTINVGPNSGIYDEQVLIPSIANTSATNKIVINGNGNLLRYKTYFSLANRAVIKMAGVDYLTIDSLKFLNIQDDTGAITAYYNYGVCAQIANDADDITIQHCTFGVPDSGLYWYNNNGIIVSDQLYGSGPSSSFYTTCDSIIIQNNKFNNGAVGMWGGLPPNQTIGCKVLNNTFSDKRDNYYAYIFNSYGYFGTISSNSQNGTIIEGNKIMNSRQYAIYTDPNSQNTLISKNIIQHLDSSYYYYSPYGSGCYFNGTNMKVVNNLIHLKTNNGGYYALMLANLTNSRISNNTIIVEPTGNYSGYGVYYNSTTSSGIIFTENIVRVSNVGSAYRAAFYMTNITGITSNYNDFGDPNTSIARVSTINYPTLAGWQAYSGQDMASDTLDPHFVSPLTYNFLPTRGALDDRGVPIPGITDDIVGTVRNVITPDIGAYEFGALPCLVPSNLAVSGITSTSANLSWTLSPGSFGSLYVLDGSPANPAGPGTYTASTTYNAAGLTPLTTYYFHVRTDCAGYYSGWVTIPFITLCNTPSPAITPATVPPLCYGATTTLSAITGTGFAYQWKRNNLNIAGATSPTYATGLAGNYTVQINMGTCSSTTNPAVVITTLPQGNITAAGSTAFCQGGAVTLNANTGTGYTYQWQRGGVNIAGATSAAYTANSTGAYRAIIYTGSCIDTSNIINVTATPYPSNIVAPAGPLAFCDRQSRRLTAALNPVYTYQWYKNSIAIPGATSYFYDVTTAGSYSVTVTNGTCSVTSNSVAVSIYPLPTATAEAVGNTVFCSTGSVFIKGTPGTGLTYQWLRNGVIIPGATGANYTAGSAGLFSVIVSNGTCSDTSVSLAVVFNAFPLPVITYVGGVLETTVPFTTYQWNRNGLAIPFANNRAYMPTLNGSYVVTVGDTSGCLGSSNVITINSLGVNNALMQTNGVNIYPNPASDKVFITCSRPTLVSLFSADGKLVTTEQANTGMLDISALAIGVYTLKVKDQAGNIMRIEKLVKVK